MRLLTVVSTLLIYWLLGFVIDDRTLRRAGMDYWEQVELTRQRALFVEGALVPLRGQILREALLQEVRIGGHVDLRLSRAQPGDNPTGRGFRADFPFAAPARHVRVHQRQDSLDDPHMWRLVLALVAERAREPANRRLGAAVRRSGLLRGQGEAAGDVDDGGGGLPREMRKQPRAEGDHGVEVDRDFGPKFRKLGRSVARHEVAGHLHAGVVHDDG